MLVKSGRASEIVQTTTQHSKELIRKYRPRMLSANRNDVPLFCSVLRTMLARAHEREENPEAFSAQGSSSDLAGLDGHSAISETQASMAGYNERRQRTQAAKAEKLAEDERRDFEIKLDQAQYEIANM